VEERKEIAPGRRASSAGSYEDENVLYKQLGETSLHIDVLIRESQFDPGKVSSLLLNLELKGLISQWPGKCFSKKL